MNFKNRKFILISSSISLIAIILIVSFLGGDDKHEHKHLETKEQVSSNTSEVWTCSMHPQIRQSEFGTCPICGMDLTKADVEDSNLEQTVLEMTEQAVQMANIQTTTVSGSEVSKEISLLGKITPDERKIFSQTAHFPGRVEKLYLNFTGESIKRGQPIVSIYSPELVTAQRELLQSLKFKDTNPSIYQATINKLKYWKLNQKQIDKIIQTKKERINFPIYSDVSGIVTKKMVNLGDHLTQGSILYEIANLKNIWVLFEVYEKDLSWIKIGDQVDFEVSSLPGKKFQSKITFIDPVVDQIRRIVSVRAEVKNENLELKPEMLVTGKIISNLKHQEEALLVPKSSVLWTGERSIVYIKLPDVQKPTFQMREVVLGNELDNSYIIKEGLEAGEEIVTNGTFAVDSSAQLKGKPSMMNFEIGMKDGKSEEKKENIKTFETVDRFQRQVVDTLSQYLKLKNAFTKSDSKEVVNMAKKTRETLDKVNMRLVKGEAHLEWMIHLENIEKNLDLIQKELDIEKQRSFFINLSKDIELVLKTFQIKNQEPIFVQVCPMANDGKGASWLSKKEEVENPYYGEAMFSCGDVSEVLN